LIIKRLLDDLEFSDGFHAAMLSNREISLQYSLEARNGTPLLGPMFDLDTIRMFDAHDIFLRELLPPTGRPTSRVPLLIPPTKGLEFVRFISQLSSPNYSRFIDQQWRALADRRATAIALAIRLYRLHNSRWPADLQELVPGYLPAVPRDPFVAGDRPINYVALPNALPDGSSRRMLLFGAIDPSAPGAPPAEPSFGWQKGIVQWRDLTLWSPLGPATQPGGSPN
jgi:hypothetical protein